jgi:CRP-like cAMP-binding protein
MTSGALGKVYQDGEVIIRQGEVGDCMFVVQEGKVEVILEIDDREVQLDVHGEG